MSESEALEVVTVGKLDNPRHERFCQLVAAGTNASESYRLAYNYGSDWKEDNADVMGPALLGELGIKTRVEALRTKANVATVATKQEVLEYLTRGFKTPLDQIDETSTLAQEVTYGPDGSKKIKSVSRLGSVEILAKLQGWLVAGSGTTINGPVQINLKSG